MEERGRCGCADRSLSGGPEIDRLARSGDRKAIRFPRAMMKGTHDFSFSGLKTAVRLAVEKDPGLKTEDVAAAFQDAVVDVLVKKVSLAIEDTGIKSISLSGGVAANSELRERMAEMCSKKGAEFYPPPINLCTDNGAMIALAGYHRFRMGERSELGLNPRAHLPIA